MQLFSKMTTYSEEPLGKLNKDDLIGIVLSIQSKMESSNAKVLEKLKLLNDKFNKLEVDVAIARNLNSLFQSLLVNAGKQYWVNAQYSRRETLETVALPKSLTNDEAETKGCQIFRSLDCNFNKEDLNVCLWLKNKERVIAKFRRRKDCEKFLKAKNNIRKLDTANLYLPEGNQGLCSCYRLLWSTSKKLHGKDRIFGWWAANGHFRKKIQENGRPLYISHTEDFKKYFPDADFQSL